MKKKVLLSIDEEDMEKINLIVEKDRRTKSQLFAKLILDYGKENGYLKK